MILQCLEGFSTGFDLISGILLAFDAVCKTFTTRCGPHSALSDAREKRARARVRLFPDCGVLAPRPSRACALLGASAGARLPRAAGAHVFSALLRVYELLMQLTDLERLR